jgi:hypothetical protein
MSRGGGGGGDERDGRDARIESGGGKEATSPRLLVISERGRGLGWA